MKNGMYQLQKVDTERSILSAAILGVVAVGSCIKEQVL